jgi:hypothetical protein
VGLNLRCSVRRGRLEVSIVFGPILESSGHSLLSPGLPDGEVDDAQVGSWRNCFVVSLLSDDAFPRGGEVDGLAYPLHRPTAHSYLPRG